jgi:hypothetical protein
MLERDAPGVGEERRVEGSTVATGLTGHLPPPPSTNAFAGEPTGSSDGGPGYMSEWDASCRDA